MVILLILSLLFFNPRKTRIGKKFKKLRKNGEANVPSGRPTKTIVQQNRIETK